MLSSQQHTVDVITKSFPEIISEWKEYMANIVSKNCLFQFEKQMLLRGVNHGKF